MQKKNTNPQGKKIVASQKYWTKKTNKQKKKQHKVGNTTIPLQSLINTFVYQISAVTMKGNYTHTHSKKKKKKKKKSMKFKSASVTTF